MSGDEWDVHYRSELPPWETGRPSSELRRVIEQEQIQPCRVIELGCGSGIDAVWLAQQGFQVTALDFNQLAIEKAQQRAATAGVAVNFELEDVLNLSKRYEPFPFFLDRGCYHAVRRVDVQSYLRTLQSVTSPGSIGLLLTGNARCPAKEGQGPPVVSDEELHAELEPAFKIVRLREFYFDQVEENSADGHLAWSCFVRRRDGATGK